MEDSVKSDENTLNLLGAYTDPIFGDIEAHFSPNYYYRRVLLILEIIRSLISCSTLNVRRILWRLHSANAFEVAALDESIFRFLVLSNQTVNATNVLASHAFYPYESNPDTLGKYSLQIPLDVLGQTILDASSDDLTDNTTFWNI